MRFFLIFLLLIVGDRSMAQRVKVQDLYGNWKVENWIWFTNTEYAETNDERSERLSDYHKCLKSIAKVSSNGIHFTHNACQFEEYYDCDLKLSKLTPMKNLKIVDDRVDTSAPTSFPILNSSVVSRKLVNLLVSGYKKDSLITINTGCKSDWGSSTFQICVASKNRIGIFSGADLIILTKISTH
jgi:hypothetical protein